jgi:hypothetical protein
MEFSRSQALRVFNVLEIRLSGLYTGTPRNYLVAA